MGKLYDIIILAMLLMDLLCNMNFI